MAQSEGKRMQGKRPVCDVDALRERLESLVRRKAPQSVIDAARKKLEKRNEEGGLKDAGCKGCADGR